MLGAWTVIDTGDTAIGEMRLSQFLHPAEGETDAQRKEISLGRGVRLRES